MARRKAAARREALAEGPNVIQEHQVVVEGKGRGEGGGGVAEDLWQMKSFTSKRQRLTPVKLAIRSHLRQFTALTGLFVLRTYKVTCC